MKRNRKPWRGRRFPIGLSILLPRRVAYALGWCVVVWQRATIDGVVFGWLRPKDRLLSLEILILKLWKRSNFGRGEVALQENQIWKGRAMEH